MNNQSSIKNRDQYDALREEGMGKEKAARIANTEDIDHDPTPYEERTREQLYAKAKEAGIDGRSKMTKDDLIRALRNE